MITYHVKCIGLSSDVGAIHIEGATNRWIQKMHEQYRTFAVVAIDVVVARTFTMATIVYRVDEQVEKLSE